MESGEIDYVFKVKKETEDKKRIVKKTIIKTVVGTNNFIRRHKPNLEAMSQHPAFESIFATGGCENDLKIWDLVNKKKMIFSARNVSTI